MFITELHAQAFRNYHLLQHANSKSFYYKGLLTPKGNAINILYQSDIRADSILFQICQLETYLSTRYQAQLKNADIIVFDTLAALIGSNLLSNKPIELKEIPYITDNKILVYHTKHDSIVNMHIIKAILKHTIKNKDAYIREQLSEHIYQQFMQRTNNTVAFMPDSLQLSNDSLIQFNDLHGFLQQLSYHPDTLPYLFLVQHLYKKDNYTVAGIDSLLSAYRVYFNNKTLGLKPLPAATAQLRLPLFASSSWYIKNKRIVNSFNPLISAENRYAYAYSNCDTLLNWWYDPYTYQLYHNFPDKRRSLKLHDSTLVLIQTNNPSLHTLAPTRMDTVINIINAQQSQIYTDSCSPAQANSAALFSPLPLPTNPPEKLKAPQQRFSNTYSLQHTRLNMANAYDFNQNQLIAAHLGHYQYEEVNIYLSKAIQDYWKNYLINLQFSLPTLAKGSDVFIKLGKYAKRIDYSLTLVRTARSIKKTNFGTWEWHNTDLNQYPVKVVSNMIMAQLTVPIHYFLELQYKPSLRFDKTIIQNVNDIAANLPSINNRLIHNQLLLKWDNTTYDKDHLVHTSNYIQLAWDNFIKTGHQTKMANALSLNWRIQEQLTHNLHININAHARYNLSKNKVLYNFYGTPNQIVRDIDSSLTLSNDDIYMVQRAVQVLRGARQNEVISTRFYSLNMDILQKIALFKYAGAQVTLQTGPYLDCLHTAALDNKHSTTYFRYGLNNMLHYKGKTLGVYLPLNRLENWNIFIKL